MFSAPLSTILGAIAVMEGKLKITPWPTPLFSAMEKKRCPWPVIVWNIASVSQEAEEE